MLLVISTPALAAEKDWENSLVTDRPDSAESSLVVGKYRLQMETSISHSHNQDAGVRTQAVFFPTLFRFGVFDWLEARMESNWLQIQKATGSATQTGFNDIALGVKGHAWDQDGFRPSSGALLHISTPTGANAYTADVFIPTFKLLNDWDLPRDFSLGTNVGFDVPERDAANQKFARFLYAIALGIPIANTEERLRLFTEMAGAVPVDSIDNPEYKADAGFTFLLTPDMQLDLFANFGLNESTTDVITGVGFSWRAL
ncbi:MAG: transporter [Deltaproteobacteria bacterium]|nr:transporter [Deltaproteobacteria bacterium]